VICPSQESLFPYYMRLGYTHVFPIAEDKILWSGSAMTGESKVMLTNVSSYLKHRKSHLPTYATTYTESYLRHVEKVCGASGGGLYRLEVEGQVCIAAVEPSGEHLFVRECLPASHAKFAVQTLLKHFSLKSAIVRTAPGDKASGLKSRPFVLMAFSNGQAQTCESGYFPFVLD